MKRILIAIMFFNLFNIGLAAQDTPVPRGQAKPQKEEIVMPPAWDSSRVFAQRDTCTLSMDLYMPKDSAAEHPCVVYVYGGGFVDNNQRSGSTTAFCRRMAGEGYVTAAIDYRKGLKGVKSSSPLAMADAMDVAVDLAVEDLFAAVRYLLDNAAQLGIDTSRMVLIGSSAGAITVLQSDYELSNRSTVTSGIPADFRFAGVVSLSGAIYSHEGKCDWRVHSPAPTMFLHGTSDGLVTYKQIRFFRMGFFGTKPLVERFRKFGYPFLCLRFDGRYHEVASFQQICFGQICWFLDKFVDQKKNWQIDATVSDPDKDIAEPWTYGFDDLYKK